MLKTVSKAASAASNVVSSAASSVASTVVNLPPVQLGGKAISAIGYYTGLTSENEHLSTNTPGRFSKVIIGTQGPLVLTGFLPFPRVTVQFFYQSAEKEADKSLFAFEEKLKMTKADGTIFFIPHSQVFSMFCEGWEKVMGNAIENSYKNHFEEKIQSELYYYALQVQISGIDIHGNIEFRYFAKDAWCEFEVSRKESYSNLPVVSAYIEKTLHERKEVFFKNYLSFDAVIPSTRDQVALLQELPRSNNNGTIIQKIKDAMKADGLFPPIMRDLINDTIKPEMKEILYFCSDDEDSHEIKIALKEIEKEVSLFLKNHEEKKNKFTSMSFEKDGAAFEELHTEIVKEIDKANQLLRLKDLFEFLNEVFFPRMKHATIVYLFLEQVIHCVDGDEEITDRLYQVIDKWLKEYREKYVINEFDAKQLPNNRCEYFLSKDAFENIYTNPFAEMFCTTQPIPNIVALLHDFVYLHSVMLGIKTGKKDISLSHKNKDIIIDCNGFKLILNMPEYLRKEAVKILKTSLPLLESFPPLSDAEIAKKKDNKALAEVFSKKRYPLKTSWNYVFEYGIELPDNKNFYVHDDMQTTLFGIQNTLSLTIEEQISLLVSLWSHESHLHGSDVNDENKVLKRKIDSFIRKMNHFLVQNVQENDPIHTRANYVECIIHCIEQSKALSSSKVKRLTIEAKIMLIRRIDEYTDLRRNLNNTELENRIAAAENDLIPVTIRNETNTHLEEYCLNVARPWNSEGNWRFLPELTPARNVLVRYTNVLLALIHSNFFNCIDKSLEGELSHRRAALIDLIFQELVAKIDPVACIAYNPDTYLKHSEQVVIEGFKHIDNIFKQNFLKEKLPSAHASHNSTNRSVVKKNKKIREIQPPCDADAAPGNTIMSRATYAVTQIKALRDFLDSISAQLPDEKVKELNLEIDKLEKEKGTQFIDGSELRGRFELECASIQLKIGEAIYVPILAERSENERKCFEQKVERRKDYLKEEIGLLLTKMEAIKKYISIENIRKNIRGEDDEYYERYYDLIKHHCAKFAYEIKQDMILFQDDHKKYLAGEFEDDALKIRYMTLDLQIEACQHFMDAQKDYFASIAAVEILTADDVENLFPTNTQNLVWQMQTTTNLIGFNTKELEKKTRPKEKENLEKENKALAEKNALLQQRYNAEQEVITFKNGLKSVLVNPGLSHASLSAYLQQSFGARTGDQIIRDYEKNSEFKLILDALSDKKKLLDAWKEVEKQCEEKTEALQKKEVTASSASSKPYLITSPTVSPRLQVAHEPGAGPSSPTNGSAKH